MEDTQLPENQEAIEEMVTKIASEYIDMPEDKVLEELKTAGFDQEDIDDIMETIAEVKAAETGSTEEEAQQMANEDSTPVKVTEVDKDSDGDADKTVVEKKEPDDDGIKNPSEEHTKEDDKPNDSVDDDDSDFASAIESANSELEKKNSVNVGGIAKTLNGLRGPGIE